MDPVAVEVASGAIVVLGGAGVGVPGEDLRVAERDAGVEGVGDAGYLTLISQCAWSEAISGAEAGEARAPSTRSRNPAVLHERTAAVPWRQSGRPVSLFSPARAALEETWAVR